MERNLPKLTAQHINMRQEKNLLSQLEKSFCTHLPNFNSIPSLAQISTLPQNRILEKKTVLISKTPHRASVRGSKNVLSTFPIILEVYTLYVFASPVRLCVQPRSDDQVNTSSVCWPIEEATNAHPHAHAHAFANNEPTGTLRERRGMNRWKRTNWRTARPLSSIMFFSLKRQFRTKFCEFSKFCNFPQSLQPQNRTFCWSTPTRTRTGRP